MTHALKKALLVFVPALVLFWLTKPSPKSKSAEKKPDPATVELNARTAFEAYMTAVNAGETPDALQELNRQIEQEYGMRVYLKRSDNRYYVADLNGKDILKS